MESNLEKFSRSWPQTLLAASRKVLLYPPNHPVVKNAIAEPFLIFQQFIPSQEKGEVTLSVHEGKLLVNGNILEGEDGHISWFISILENTGIESLTVSSGITQDELGDFIRILIAKPEYIKEKGGIREAVGQKNITHVMVNEVRYAKVKEAMKEEPEEAKSKGTGVESGAGGGTTGQPVAKNVRKRIGIKEYKALEKKHREVLRDKERVDNVIRNIAEGLVVVDSDGNVLLMNPAAERLLGISQKEGVGKKLTDNLSQGQMLALAKGRTDESAEGGLHEIELAGSDESTKRVLRASTAVVENQDGKTVGMVSVLSDITKQKEIDKLKSDFISNVSHELRTPLIAIEKAISLVMGSDSGTPDDERKKFLEIAHRNLDRLTRLINDLLDISKIEAGKMKLNPVPGDLGDVIQHVLETLAPWAKQKDIRLEKYLPAYRVEIFMDADKIIQVLTNLIGNGIKFTHKGGRVFVEVTYRLPDELFPKTSVQVTIQDTGIGVAQEDMSRIFDKFEQVKGVHSSGIGGTGLGLPIAKEIIQMHGGKLWVESTEGSGSKFIFLLPKEEGKDTINEE